MVDDDHLAMLRARAQQAQENQERLVRCWQQALIDPNTGRPSYAGEIILADLMSVTGFDTAFRARAPRNAPLDPVALAMAEGRREICLHILAILKLNPSQLRTKDQLNHGDQLQAS